MLTTHESSAEKSFSSAEWRDWRWQQRNAIRSAAQLVREFPGLSKEVARRIEGNLATRRLQITPYCLALIQRTEDGSAPLADDPLWLQLTPGWVPEEGHDRYDSETENWELPHEMVTPIAQNKYGSRVIVRLSNNCFAYCQFCYEALRTIEKESPKEGFQRKYWQDTVDYVRQDPKVREVILSGGEPLLLGDEQLHQVLSDLRSIDRPLIIRIHTRALTFNPFRITPVLLERLAQHRVTALGLHVSCERELTSEFRQAVDKLHGAVPILFANIPLLKGVNDSAEAMERLGMALYGMGVIPHYLYHFMPFSPGSTVFRTSVKQGVEIVRQLKRRLPNMAVPEFVLPHQSGKYTMPLLSEGETPPERVVTPEGHIFIRYINWRGEVVDYPEIA